MIATEKLNRRMVDETGNRHGRLTVTGFAGVDHLRNANWTCVCDCGGVKTVQGSHLRRGLVKSCGCLNKEMSWHKLPLGEGAFNYLCERLKRTARNRGYEFGLTKEQVRDIVTQNCNYCGSPPTQVTKYQKCNGSFTYNGIDRKNNSLGYVVTNVFSCCGRCNRAKDTMGVDEFKAWIAQVYEHSVEGQSE